MQNSEANVVNVRKHELVKKGYRDFEDWASGKNNVYIGRNMTHYVPGTVGSIWGNPYVVAKDNNYKPNTYTLDQSLTMYRQYVESTPELIARLHELKGKTLGCWCKPNRCHGDILVELVEKYCK